ncbi:MAG: DUF6541 family protein [Myxococcota bacterium]
MALVLAGLAWLGAPLPTRGLQRATRYGRWLAPLGVCFVAAVMMPDVLLGDRPVSHDHPVHFFKAWQFDVDLLAEGKLFGWSNRLFAGYPVNYLYPIGPDLWVSMFYTLGVGMLSMSQAYSLAFFGCFAFSGYAVYRLGERVTGSHVMGFVAGALFLTDSGSFRYGGWEYTVEYGVWPQTLSLSFAVLAIARLSEILEGHSWRPVGLYALFMGLALLCHPMPLLLFPLVVVLAVAMHLGHAMQGGDEARVGPGAGLWRLAIAHIVGGIIAAAWLLPFFSVKSMADRYGVPWLSSYQIASRLMSGDLFDGTAPVLWVATVAGTLMLWRSETLLRRFVPWLMLALLAVGISSIADELHFDAFTDAVSHIQFSRVTILMKPFIFVAAAVAVVRAFRWLLAEGEARSLQTPQARWRRAVTVGCVALVLAPIGASFGVHFYTRSMDRELKTLTERTDQDDRDALVRYLNEQPAIGPLERVAFLTSFHEHGVIDMATELNRPVYKTGFTPCSNYLYKMRSGSPSLLAHLSVRWVVATKDRTEKVYEEVTRFGRYRLYRFTRFDENPLVVKGSGDVSLVSFDDEEIVVDAGPGAEGYLRLPVSWFPRWTATRDGAAVPLEAWSHPADKKRTGFISAPLAPGRTVFRFEPSALDRYAPLLLPLGLLLVLLLSFATGPLRGVGAGLDAFGGALDRRFGRWPQVAPWVLGGLCLVVVAVGVGLGSWTPAMEYDSASDIEIGAVTYDFLEELSEAEVSVLAEPEPRACDWRLDRFVCRPAEWYHVTSRPERIEAYSFRRCISAHPMKEGPLEIRFPDVPVGDAIVGYVGVAESGKRGKGRPVDLLVEVGGEKLLKKTSRREARRNWFHRALDAKHQGADGVTEVVFTVSAKDPRHRHLCFYAQMIDYP